MFEIKCYTSRLSYPVSLSCFLLPIVSPVWWPGGWWAAPASSADPLELASLWAASSPQGLPLREHPFRFPLPSFLYSFLWLILDHSSQCWTWIELLYTLMTTVFVWFDVVTHYIIPQWWEAIAEETFNKVSVGVSGDSPCLPHLCIPGVVKDLSRGTMYVPQHTA